MNIAKFRVIFFVILILQTTLLTGCRQSQYIENRAYAVMMGIDRETDGAYRITVRIPGIGGGGKDEGSGEGKSEYLSFSANGGDFPDALKNLRTGIPRELNLSALTVIAISEDIASSAQMPLLLDTLASERKIFGTTQIAICEGDAGEFVEKQEPVIGNILSEGLTSRLENLSEAGYIPSSQLDLIYYKTKSIYSDPIVMLCALADGSSDENGLFTAGALPVETDSKNRYLGAGVMKNGVLAGKLDGQKTMYVNLLRGHVDGFSLSDGSRGVQLALLKKPDIHIELSEGSADIDIGIKLSALGIPDMPDVSSLEEKLEEEIGETIKLLQSMKAEPFGFAEIAASDFFTIGSWQAIDWHELFSQAAVRVNVAIKPVDKM